MLQGKRKWRSGTILAVGGSLASIIALGFFFVDRWFLGKDLEVVVVSVEPLFTKKHGPGYELLYDGKRIENLSNILLSIRNNGDRTIRSNDFSGALEFKITGIDRVLSTEQVESKPAGVDFAMGYMTNNVVYVKPGLLNRGDSGKIMIKVGCELNASITVSLARARVAGIGAVQMGTTETKWEFALRWMNHLFLVILLGALGCLGVVILAGGMAIGRMGGKGWENMP